MKTSRMILVAIALMAFTFTANAGEKEGKREKQRGFGSFQFQFGFHMADNYDGFNNHPSTSLFPDIPTTYNSIGVGGYRAFKNHWVFGGEIHYGFASSENNTYRTLAHRAGHLMYAGYVVYQDRWFKLYPLIGWTGSINILNIHQKLDENPDFGQFFDQPLNASSMYNRVGALSLGVQLDFKTRNKVRSPIIGLRMGYELAAKGEWKSFGHDFQNAPEDGVGGFYIKLNFGFINHDKVWERKRKKTSQE